MNWKKFYKNHWFKLILLVSSLFLITIVVLFFPKNITRLLLFAFLFISDYYIWRAFRKWFFSLKKHLKNLLVSIYWLPSLLLMVLMVRVMFLGYDAFINTTSYAISGALFVTYCIKFFFSMFVLISDARRYSWWWLNKMFAKKKHASVPKRKRWFIGLGLTLSFLILLLFIWGAYQNSYKFKVEQVTIESPLLPASFDGFKVVQISDIHFVSWVGQAEFQKVINKINEQHPDLVVFTGDLVTFRSSEAIEFIPLMRKISARYGVYSILGNHDYGEYVNWNSADEKSANMDQLYSVYQLAGWHLLRNEHVYLKNSVHDSIALLGVENWSKNPRFKSKGDINLAMNGVPDSIFKILLSHDPSHWEFLLDHKIEIDLTLSGHTHGMQFAYISKTMQVSPISMSQKYWAGKYHEVINNRDEYLYVNTGLGTVGYLSRVGVLPEITVITLKRSKR
jgi:uncharacterized protein